ncbi:MAG: SRPBCC family protein [Thermoanaerobaculia bacterium]|nr:SRPBCC family protein [Thermoanaerobaculia bacterium]
MTNTAVGTITKSDDEYALLLERTYPVPVERVWAALVEPEKLARWLAPVRHDGRVGGAFRIDFGSEQAGGEILAYDPPRELAFEWREGDEDASVVRFELEASEGGTRLRLTHTRQTAEMAAGTGPGWHAHLVVLEVVLGGGAFDLDRDYRQLYEDAKPLYAGAVPAEAP